VWMRGVDRKIGRGSGMDCEVVWIIIFTISSVMV